MEKVYIYCDESRHTMTSPDKYMVLGSLWFNDKDKHEIKQKVTSLLAKYSYTSEIKWTRLSDRRIEVYKKLVDAIKSLPVFFRAIVVDKTKIDLNKYHSNNVELSHTKFLYLLLRELVKEDNKEYIVLLDYKDRDTKSRLRELRKFLALQCLPSSKIRQLQDIVSHENVFVQLVDMLIGAIGYELNDINASDAKSDFCSYLKKSFKISSFKATSSKQNKKFNLFNIVLT